MTKIVTAIALMFLPFLSFSQEKILSDLHEKYKEDNVLTVNLNGKDIKFRLLAVSNTSKHYSPRDIRRLKKEIRRRSFEELVAIKSEDGQLQLHVKDKNGKPTEGILIIDKDSEGFITMDFSQ
jgi:hypothetical protein